MNINATHGNTGPEQLNLIIIIKMLLGTNMPCGPENTVKPIHTYERCHHICKMWYWSYIWYVNCYNYCNPLLSKLLDLLGPPCVYQSAIGPIKLMTHINTICITIVKLNMFLFSFAGGGSYQYQAQLKLVGTSKTIKCLDVYSVNYNK